jgi:hypothetical protein
MPLRDHFHPPLSTVRHWESLHARWASALADSLNQDLLPPGYYAEEQVHVGSRVEIDVATFENQEPRSNGHGQETATVVVRAWTPPAPLLQFPAVFPDRLEVLIFNSEAGPTLVAAVELISPGNKDRLETRRAFASKSASYLQQGVGLMVVDIVTNRQANLHNELMQLLGLGAEYLLPAEGLRATSYRPQRQSSADTIAVWSASLAIGQLLPTLPLALDKGVCVPLNLETTYSEACERRRLP